VGPLSGNRHAGTGPGTSTSDSISARLSTGEFVVKADAVKHYGVGFMAQVNQMRFADGGLVHPLANQPMPMVNAPRVRTPAFGGVRAASTGQQAPTINLRNVNLVDSGLITSAMDSAAGETVVLNIISRNAVKVKQRLR